MAAIEGATGLASVGYGCPSRSAWRAGHPALTSSTLDPASHVIREFAFRRLLQLPQEFEVADPHEQHVPVIHRQFLFTVDRQQQMVSPEAQVLDAGGGQSSLGGSHDAHVITLSQTTLPICRQRVDPLIDYLVFGGQRFVGPVPVAPNRDIFVLPTQQDVIVRRLQCQHD